MTDIDEAPVLESGPVSKHAQLRSILAELVESSLAPHAAIPPERKLMTRYGVSRSTVREAIRQLVEEGVLYRVQGKGTFVAGERVQSDLHLASFTEDMRRRGLVPATIVRSARLVEAPLAVRAALGLKADALVLEIERLRLADGVPMALERGYYPAELLPELGEKDLTRSLYATFATEYGLRIDNAEQAVWAEAADPKLADTLGIVAGAPLIVFRRTSSAGSAYLEHVTSWYRGDRYQIHMTLNLQHQP
ncbi:GntR family transcriptional regulator [Cryobacterium zhongshanensis]|uniref:GntR family transcriptional regulator n=1 Tax=Cryobacterium zhongshanensis TaxID=2928153 RepID=A0AA41QUM1_9MICO|nr:GntR family transcriptional regulator [Cryobacterium zhongshanensis]MCI4656581.1 GntR family transcriptional regulator [Cryobacterium zhongshanensis]